MRKITPILEYCPYEPLFGLWSGKVGIICLPAAKWARAHRVVVLWIELSLFGLYEKLILLPI